MKPVKFLKRHSVYNIGEIAGFDEPLYSELIRKGIARPMTTETKTIEPVEENHVEVKEEITVKDHAINGYDVLRLTGPRIQQAIHEKDENGYIHSDETLQQLIAYETSYKNRSTVKKILQNEIIHRLQEKTKASQEAE